MRTRWPSAAVVLGLLLLSACESTVSAYTRKEPLRIAPPLPAGRIDVEASEVSINLAQADIASRLGGNDVRREVAEAIDDMIGGTGAAPARFRLRGMLRIEKAFFATFPCLFVLIFFGCPVQAGAADLDLDLQIGPRRYSVSASDWVWNGMYYNTDIYRASLANSLKIALKKLADQVQASGGAR